MFTNIVLTEWTIKNDGKVFQTIVRLLRILGEIQMKKKFKSIRTFYHHWKKNMRTKHYLSDDELFQLIPNSKEDLEEYFKNIFRIGPYKSNNRKWWFIHVPDSLKTPEMCLTTIQQNALALEYVPENLKAKELCLGAIRLAAEGKS